MSITPWSYSSIKSFEQCPKQFYHLRIAKDYKQGHTEAMDYGTKVHLVAEEYIRDGKPVPDKYIFMDKLLKPLNAKQGKKLTEVRMGLTDDLEPCTFKAKEVWWRGIADLIIINDNKAFVVDYKTSKSAKYADKGQLELMAIATFKHFPQVTKIHAGLLFVVAKKLIKHKYTDDMIQDLCDKWIANYKRMEVAYEEDIWNARPSGLCRNHCAVLECVHNGSN